MDPVGKNSEANKLLVHNLGSVKAREFMHPSQLAWVSHWKHLSNTHPSQGNFKLPYLGIYTKKAPSENPPRVLNQNQFRKFGTDTYVPSDSQAKDSCRDGHGLVEVRPTLLQPVENIISEFDTIEGADALFELVARSPTIVASLSPLMVQSPRSISPASHASPRPLASVAPEFPSDKKIKVSFAHEANSVEVAAGESSLPHLNGMSCEAQSLPLVLSECNVQESCSAAKAKDVQLDLENQPNQMFTPTIDNSCLFDSEPDKDKFIGSISDGLMHEILMPSELRSCGCSKGKNKQGSLTATNEEHINFSHSTYCEDEHCRWGSCLTFPYVETKVKTAAEMSCIHHLHGKIIQRFYSVEFSEGTSKYTHGSKFVEMPCRIPKAMPTFSIHDLGTLRAHKTVVEVERAPRDPSKFSKTTQHLMISKRTNVFLSKEENSVRKQLLGAESDQSAFLGTADLLPLSCSYEERAVMIKSSSKACKTNLPSKYFHGSHNRSNGHAEDRLPKRHEIISSLRYMAGDEIMVGGNHSDAFYQQSYALPTSDENEKLRDENNGFIDSVHSRASYYDMRNESSSKRDQLDLKTFPGNSGRTTSTIHKDPLESKTSFRPLHLPLDKESESLKRHSSKLSRNVDLSSCSNLNGHVKEVTSAPSAHNLDSEHLQSYGDQSPLSSSSSGTVSDPSSRWVKCLKNSHLEAFGTKRSSIEDVSDEVKGIKGIKLFKKVINYSKSTCRALLSSGMHEHEHEQKIGILGVATSPRWTKSDVELFRGNRKMLSNHWIQRLCSSKLQGAQMSAEVTSEPECMRVFSGVQPKEFPSLGAMALMGKALRNLRPYEFSKAGSLVVWGTAGKRDEAHNMKLMARRKLY